MSEDTRSRPSATPAGFLTAMGLAAIAGLIAMPLLAADPVDGAVGQWGRFLGRFHPVVLHLPIGMLALVLLMEFGQLFRKEKRSTLVPAFFTAASAILAVIFGFLLYQSKPGEYQAELVESHLWWSIGFAGLMVAAVILKAWIQLAGGAGNWIYVLTLVATGGVMTVASHDGGSLTHGKSFLTDEAPNEVREIYNLLPVEEKLPLIDDEGGKGPGSAGAVPVVPVADQVVYTHLVQPIFEQKCVSCHGEEKQKGKLRMDSYEALLAGGKEGEAIEPGDAEGSNIMFRIHLPEDDDEHMPPEGKTQMEAHEIAIVEWWLDAGASPDLKVVDAGMPEEIKSAVAQLVPPEVIAAQKAEAEQAAAKEAEEREALSSVVESLREEFPSALNFESRESSALTFTAVSMRKDFNDDHLGKLGPVMESMVSLDLSATGVTDEGVRSLEGAKSLRMLRLSETGVTDEAIEVIAGLPELESLNLYGTRVTNTGVSKLAALPKLKRLYLWQTEVDEAGAEALRKQMPDCEVVMGL